MLPLSDSYFFHCFKQAVYNIPNCKQLLSLTFKLLIYCLGFFPSLRKESLALFVYTQNTLPCSWCIGRRECNKIIL